MFFWILASDIYVFAACAHKALEPNSTCFFFLSFFAIYTYSGIGNEMQTHKKKKKKKREKKIIKEWETACLASQSQTQL